MATRIHEGVVALIILLPVLSTNLLFIGPAQATEPDGAMQVTFDPWHDRYPTWSPDGTMIAFARGSSTTGSNIWVTYTQDGVDVPASGAVGVARRMTNVPNPFSASTTICIDADEAISGAKVRIFSLLGRLVRVLPLVGGTGTTLMVRWDGRDDSGRVLPSGIYFYQFVDATGASHQERVTIHR